MTTQRPEARAEQNATPGPPRQRRLGGSPPTMRLVFLGLLLGGIVLTPGRRASAKPCALKREARALYQAYRLAYKGWNGQGAPPLLGRHDKGLWKRVTYQRACRRWVVDALSAPDEVHRLAAAAWAWRFRYRHKVHNLGHLSSALLGFHWFTTRGFRPLPIDKAVASRWISEAGAEKHPIVLRVKLTYLITQGFRREARALLRANPNIIFEMPLARLAFTLWMSDPKLSRAEREVLWKMRKGTAGSQAKAVLSKAHDPAWIRSLTQRLSQGNLPETDYTYASLAGLGRQVFAHVLPRVDAHLAHHDDCFFWASRSVRALTGYRVGLMTLARRLLRCPKKLSTTWDDLLEGMFAAPDAARGLAALATLQHREGIGPMASYGEKALNVMAGITSEEISSTLVSLAHLAQVVPKEKGGPYLWRVAPTIVKILRSLGTPRAGDAIVEVMRVTAGPCAADGQSCLWRIRSEALAAIKKIGGPGMRTRLQAARKIHRKARRRRRHR